MKWLITGGCGFIGTRILHRLTQVGGHQIRIVDNLSVGTFEDLKQVCAFVERDASDLSADAFEPDVQVQFVRGDILDEELALAAAAGTDVIVHLAANTGVAPSVADPRRDCVVNVLGTLNYLEAARHNQVKRFIFASSGAPVGEVAPPIHEEVVPHPVSPYGASKLAGEAYCSAFFRTYGIDTVALRFGNVYGPGSIRKTSVVATYLRAGLKGEPLHIHGDGMQTRDFIYVDDLVEAVHKSAEALKIGGEVVQIATSRETSISELAQLVRQEFVRRTLPAPSIRFTEPRIGDVRRNYSDTSKARRLLGWTSRTSLARGLEMTLDNLTRRTAE